MSQQLPKETELAAARRHGLTTHKMGDRGKCGRCGKLRHTEERRCPALQSKCNKCRKKEHWERELNTHSHSKAVSEITEEVKQIYFLGEVGGEDSQDKAKDC